jgi:hypothetical protein
MEYSVTGVKQGAQQSIQMELDDVYVDTTSNVKIVIHHPTPTFENGSIRPNVSIESGGLLDESWVFTKHSHQSEWGNQNYIRAPSLVHGKWKYFSVHDAKGFVPNTSVLIRATKVVASSAILAAPGCGELLIAYPFCSVGTSPIEERVRLALRLYMGACIHQPDNVLIFPNVFIEGITDEQFFWFDPYGKKGEALFPATGRDEPLPTVGTATSRICEAFASACADQIMEWSTRNVRGTIINNTAFDLFKDKISAAYKLALHPKEVKSSILSNMDAAEVLGGILIDIMRDECEEGVFEAKKFLGSPHSTPDVQLYRVGGLGRVQHALNGKLGGCCPDQEIPKLIECIVNALFPEIQHPKRMPTAVYAATGDHTAYATFDSRIYNPKQTSVEAELVVAGKKAVEEMAYGRFDCQDDEDQGVAHVGETGAESEFGLLDSPEHFGRLYGAPQAFSNDILPPAANLRF